MRNKSSFEVHIDRTLDQMRSPTPATGRNRLIDRDDGRTPPPIDLPHNVTSSTSPNINNKNFYAIEGEDTLKVIPWGEILEAHARSKRTTSPKSVPQVLSIETNPSAKSNRSPNARSFRSTSARSTRSSRSSRSGRNTNNRSSSARSNRSLSTRNSNGRNSRSTSAKEVRSTSTRSNRSMSSKSNRSISTKSNRSSSARSVRSISSAQSRNSADDMDEINKKRNDRLDAAEDISLNRYRTETRSNSVNRNRDFDTNDQSIKSSEKSVKNFHGIISRTSHDTPTLGELRKTGYEQMDSRFIPDHTYLKKKSDGMITQKKRREYITLSLDVFSGQGEDSDEPICSDEYLSVSETDVNTEMSKITDCGHALDPTEGWLCGGLDSDTESDVSSRYSFRGKRRFLSNNNEEGTKAFETNHEINQRNEFENKFDTSRFKLKGELDSVLKNECAPMTGISCLFPSEVSLLRKVTVNNDTESTYKNLNYIYNAVPHKERKNKRKFSRVKLAEFNEEKKFGRSQTIVVAVQSNVNHRTKIDSSDINFDGKYHIGSRNYALYEDDLQMDATHWDGSSLTLSVLNELSASLLTENIYIQPNGDIPREVNKNVILPIDNIQKPTVQNNFRWDDNKLEHHKIRSGKLLYIGCNDLGISETFFEKSLPRSECDDQHRAINWMTDPSDSFGVSKEDIIYSRELPISVIRDLLGGRESTPKIMESTPEVLESTPESTLESTPETLESTPETLESTPETKFENVISLITEKNNKGCAEPVDGHRKNVAGDVQKEARIFKSLLSHRTFGPIEEEDSVERLSLSMEEYLTLPAKNENVIWQNVPVHDLEKIIKCDRTNFISTPVESSTFTIIPIKTKKEEKVEGKIPSQHSYDFESCSTDDTGSSLKITANLLFINEYHKDETIIKLQSWIRGVFLRNMISLMQKSAVLLQKHWRKLKAQTNNQIKSEELSKIKAAKEKSLISAVLSIQYLIRSHLTRKGFDTMTDKAVIIQKMYRGYKERLIYHSKVRENTQKNTILLKHIIFLQSFVRRYVCLKQLTEAKKMAVVVQTCYRRHNANKRYETILQNVLRLQCLVRQKSAGEVLQRLKSCIFIQSHIRTYFAMKRMCTTINLIVIIQKIWRGSSQRRNYLQTSAHVIILQTFYRSRKVKKELTKHNIIVQLQRIVRRRVAQNIFRRSNERATILQKTVRRFLMVRKFRAKIGCMIMIQNFVRTCKAKESIRQLREQHARKLIIKTQSLIRGLCQKKRYTILKEKAVIVQNLFRELLVRKHHHFLIEAAILLQRNFRLRQTKKTLETMKKQQEISYITTIQKEWRCYTFKKKHQNDMKALTVLQLWYRGIQAKRECLRLDLEQKVFSASKIQTNWRCHVSQHTYCMIRHSSIVLQCLYRKIKAINKHQKMKMNYHAQFATVVQKKWRSYICAKKYRIKVEKAVSIECWIRSWMSRRVSERLRRKSIIMLAIKIQSSIRGHISRHQYLNTIFKVILIQKIYRGYAKKEQYFSQRKGAIILQKMYRRTQAKNKMDKTRKELRMYAAIKIQTEWRRFQCNKEFLICCRKSRAAQKIQSYGRGFIQRKAFVLMRPDPILINRSLSMEDDQVNISFHDTFRSITGSFDMIEEIRIKITKHEKARIIQKHWRGTLLKRVYHHDLDAIIMIQKIYRKREARLKYINSISNIIKSQSYVRRLEVQRKLQTQREKVLVIQNIFRGIAGRRKYLLMQKWCILIQALCRQMIAKKRLKKLKFLMIMQSIVHEYLSRRRRKENASAIVISKFFRKCIYKKNACHKISQVILIQSIQRKKIAKRQLKQLRCILQTQSIIRGYLQKKLFLKYKGVVIMQRIYRGYLCRKKYDQKSIKIIMVQSVFRKVLARRQFEKLQLTMNSQTIIHENLQKRNAITIQRTYRAYACRKSFSQKQKESVTENCTIKSTREQRVKIIVEEKTKANYVLKKIRSETFKMIDTVELLHSKEMIAKRLQNCYRAQKAKQKLTRLRFNRVITSIEIYGQVVNSANKIQSWWKCFNRTKVYAHRNAAKVSRNNVGHYMPKDATKGGLYNPTGMERKTLMDDVSSCSSVDDKETKITSSIESPKDLSVVRDRGTFKIEVRPESVEIHTSLVQ